MADTAAFGAHKLIAFGATANPAAARHFYGDTLGLPLVSADPFALVFDANGTMLRVTTVPEVRAVEYTVLGWEVADITTAVERLAAAGVRPERYPGLDQDEAGVWTSPGGARVAWFKDPDGNTLSVTQF